MKILRFFKEKWEHGRFIGETLEERIAKMKVQFS